MKRWRESRRVDGLAVETRVLELRNDEQPPIGAVAVPDGTPLHGWGEPRNSDYSPEAPESHGDITHTLPEYLAAETREKPKVTPAVSTPPPTAPAPALPGGEK